MARPALLAAAALVWLALAPAAGAKVPPGFVGVTAEDVFAGDDNHRTSNLSAQAAIGIQTIRQTFDWSTIEREHGRYDLHYHDAYVAKAAAHGIRIVPVLFKPPGFHGRTRGRATCPPRRNATFARFADALVRRYGRRGTLWRERPDVAKKPIIAWQIWNEPSLGIYWCNRPNARAYVRMLRTVGRAIRRADRKAHIVTAGLPSSKLKSAVRLERYIKQMYRAGARRAFDSLAINPYAENHRDLRRLLRSVRTLMNRRQDRRAGIWITELGWSNDGPRSRFRAGRRGQARLIGRAFRVLARERRRLRLRGVVYYSWRDALPYPPLYRDLWGLHTGLLDINGGFKPAFYAFKQAVARLR